MAKRQNTLPAEIYVVRDKNGDGAEEDLLAWRDIASSIEDDGPTTIGVYGLLRVVKRKKIIAEAK